MPTTWNGMVREMVEGVPVWRSTGGDLFLYDQDLTKELVKVGTIADGFAVDWAERMQPHLEAYRATTTTRQRATGSGRAGKN